MSSIQAPQGGTSVTAALIQQLLAAADEAENRFFEREFPTKDAAMEAGGNLLTIADRTVRGGALAFADAVRAMKNYGACRGIARRYAIDDAEITNSQARCGQVLRAVIVPNRDEARRKAYEVLEEVSTRYAAQGKRSESGAEAANAALCILEMSAADQILLEKARVLLERSVELKNRPSDIAFSRFNLALCLRLIAEADSDNEELLKQADRLLDRASKEFDKLEEAPIGLASTLPLNRSQIVRGRIRGLRSREGLKILLSHRHDVPEWLRQRFDANPVDFASAITSNPAAYGMSSAPGWATPHISVNVHERLYERALDALSTAISSASGLSEARLLWERHLLASTYLNTWSVDEDAVEALKLVWVAEDHHVYFEWARSMIALEPDDPARDDYTEILRRIAACITTLRRGWASNDIERLLRSNDTTFRFLACRLANFSEYEVAFEVLELTRGLISTRTMQIMDVSIAKGTRSNSSCSWVHLTHSPAATVVIGLNETLDGAKCYFGRTFPTLSGRTLAVLFSGVVDYGLIAAQQAGNRTDAAAAATTIAKELTPVADFIMENATGVNIRICPGGYFQAFPVASIETADGLVLGAQMRTAIAPSRTLAAGTDSPVVMSEPVMVASADAVPGYESLPFAALDLGAIARYFEIASVSATAVDLQNLEDGPGTVLHFSGHSYADIDPSKSSMILYGGKMAASDILQSGPRPAFCVLSSCQSGAAHNFQAQDEFLSIQSAFLYAGGQVSIGTSWPVGDLAAYCFTQNLYRQLAAHDKRDASAWIAAFWNSQEWIRRVSLDEIRRLIDESEGTVGLPSSVLGRSSDYQPFASFYDWASFTILARQ